MTPKRKRPRARPRPPRFLPYLSDSPETRAAELERYRAYSLGRRPAAPKPPKPAGPRAPRIPAPRDPERLYADESAACVRFGRDFYADRGAFESDDEGEPLRIDGYASDLAEAAIYSVRKRPIATIRPGSFLVSLGADLVADGFHRAKARAEKKEARRSPAP